MKASGGRLLRCGLEFSKLRYAHLGHDSYHHAPQDPFFLGRGYKAFFRDFLKSNLKNRLIKGFS
ncbi:MAG: hypothetical protein ACLFOA_09205, partial [Desulfohalobiaceae bacterium]